MKNKKRRYTTKQTKRRIFVIKGLLMSIGVIVIINYAIAGVREVYDYLAYQPVLAVLNYPKIEERELTVIEKIVKYSKQYGVNPDDALRIAYCESRFKPNAKNGVSTASGLWQFTEGTFRDGIRWRGLDWNLEDRFDVDKSTDMAMWFVNREGWNRWACK